MPKWKWLYKRDFTSTDALYLEARKWHAAGYRVFIQGYSAGDCEEFKG